MSAKRLVDYYVEDITGLTSKALTSRKRLWHRAARDALFALSITSDTPSPDPIHNQKVDVTDRADDAETYPVRTTIRRRFFLTRPIDELVELYRLTKSAARPIRTT